MSTAFSEGPLAPTLEQPLAHPLEGTDQSYATVILPAPPPLSFIQTPMNKRPGEFAKRPLPSFIPSSDPGSTYATQPLVAPIAVTSSVGSAALDDANNARRKRARGAEKPPVSSSAPPSAARPPRLSGVQTPLEHANSSPLRGSTPLVLPDPVNGVVEEEVLAPAILPVLRLTVNGAQLVPDTPSTDPTSSLPPSAKRPRGRPRKPNQPPTGDVLDIVLKDEATPEPPVTIIREPPPATFRNDDICACCSIPHIESNSGPLSHFLYCDGCTRSFHMGCLDPPIVDDRDQPPPDKEWFCPACSAEKSLRGSLPLDPSPFDHLTHLLHGALPKTFALPEDVRGHFKGVGVGRHGVYVNVGEVKPGRANRQGFLEDRDPARIRDRENNLIVCYKCQRTALPRTQLISESSSPVLNENAISSDPSTSTAVSSSHRPERRAKVAADLALQSNRIISCDYCSSHWHLDCLDPPMVHMPSPLKKWMCPNHAEQVMPKRRALKVPKTIEVHRRHVKNNGNIDVIPSAEDAAQDRRYEEVWINAKKYMIPEKTIRLDFLDKVNGVQSPAGPSRIRDRQPTHYRNSSTSSSLTSLPPSDGEDEDSESEESDDDDARQASIATLEELYTKSDAAVALLSLHERRPTAQGTSSNPRIERLVHSALSKPSALPPSNGVSIPPPQPPTLNHSSPVKAGSTATSFRIRLNRAPVTNGKAPEGSSHPPATNSQPTPAFLSPPQHTYTNGRTASGTYMPSASLSSQEIQQLIQVQALMRAKGEQKMLHFLTSDD